MKTAHTNTDTSLAHYCLGTGEKECNECNANKTWHDLNEFGNDERLRRQSKMHKVNIFECILGGRKWFS